MKMCETIHNKRGFTLIEMLIVLIIMGILLMATMVLSGDQIHKIKDKTIKESILAEMQSRYSRNLGSSSFVGVMYNTLDVTLSRGENKIDFKYNTTNNTTGVENTFTDNFRIRYITANFNFENSSDAKPIETIKLKYYPYKMFCNILEGDEEKSNVVVITRINNNRDYCFEIKQKNCRLIELSEGKCNYLKDLAYINE